MYAYRDWESSRLPGERAVRAGQPHSGMWPGSATSSHRVGLSLADQVGDILAGVPIVRAAA
jgi:hypothetical protein